MSRARVGGIDDPIWSSRAGAEKPRSHIGLRRGALSVLALPGLPALAVLVHGFDWVSLVAGVAAGAVVLAVVHGRIVAPVAFGLLLLVVGFGALEGVNLYWYHTASLSGPPPSLHWCGRDYDVGTRTWPVPPTPAGSQGERVVLVTPSGAAIYSPFSCTPHRGQTLLFTPVGPSAWVAYGLQGGP